MSDAIPLLDALSLFEGNELALYQISSQFGDIDSAPLAEIRDVTLAFLEPLVEEGYLEGGRVLVPIEDDPRSWVPLDGTTAEVLDHARRIWDEEGRHPQLVDDIWFMLTPSGERALERERAVARRTVEWPLWTHKRDRNH